MSPACLGSLLIFLVKPVPGSDSELLERFVLVLWVLLTE